MTAGSTPAVPTVPEEPRPCGGPFTPFEFAFTGKAPPSLPQGAPPLLHSQYLVGPGGLLPAYPVSARGALGRPPAGPGGLGLLLLLP